MRHLPQSHYSFDKRLLDISEKLSEQDYFIAIRRGLILPFPLLLIGALTLLVRYPPLDWTHYVVPNSWLPMIDTICNILQTGTFGVASLVVLSGFASVLTRLQNKKRPNLRANPAITATIVLSCFFIIITPPDGSFSLASLSLFKGLLISCLVASTAGWLFLHFSGSRFFKLRIKALSTDPVIGDVFDAIPAAAAVILLFATIKTLLVLTGSTDVAAQVNHLVSAPFIGMQNDLLMALGSEATSQILWFFGMHGPSALSDISSTVFYPAMTANSEAYAHGLTPENIVTSQFISSFARMGGSGSTLSLIFALLLTAEQSNCRKFAMLAFIPALFNINEPLIFGVPLVLNPIFAIPFILAPVIQLLLAYIATYLDLLPLTTQDVIWTTPAILKGYLATDHAISGALFQVINLAVGTAIYFPFVRFSRYLSVQRNKRTLETLLEITESNPIHYPTSRLIDLMGEEGRMALALADDLRQAMRQDNQLFLEYQPQVDVKRKRVVGAEVLLRWIHPQFGRIAPPVIVTLAEDLHIIEELGYKILRLACRQRMEWSNQLDEDFVISVNVSPKQLAHEDFDQRVMTILEESGLPPHLLELEITETTALLPELHSIDCLTRLRDAGVKIALDDFGMGHTSLHYLRLLPLDKVKIDRSLTIANNVNQQIVKSIWELSQSLGLTMIVEGTEKEEQVHLFTELGCTTFQGYFFSKPLPAEDMIDFTKKIGFWNFQNNRRDDGTVSYIKPHRISA